MNAHVGKLVSGRMDDLGRSRKGRIKKTRQESSERCPALALVEMKGMYDVAFLHDQFARRRIEPRLQESKSFMFGQHEKARLWHWLRTKFVEQERAISHCIGSIEGEAVSFHEIHERKTLGG